MLQTLSLRDFVIVDQLELDLSSGFTVLTGETGAGKSILLDALSLVLGERRYVHMIVSNLLSLAVVYLIFQTAFSVVLPTGFVERMFQ